MTDKPFDPALDPAADASPTPSRLRTALLVLAGVAGGFLVALVLFRGPLGLPGGTGTADSAAAGVAGEADQLWTCGMHPEVIQAEPGQCPICRMDLVPVAAGADAHAGHDHGEGGKVLSDGGREVLFYRNPMNPTVTSPVPAKDEMGMDYVPVYAESAQAAGGATVRIDPSVVQNMNVRTAPVERRDLTREIRTVGYLDYDQERMVTVTTKYSGWIEKVYVNYVGEPVRRGQPLFEIYSPELVQTEQELLSALDFSRQLGDAPEDTRRRAQSLVDSARTRLGYWDVTGEQIDRLLETGEVFRTLTVEAPSRGVVMKRMDGLEGMAVRPGMEIFHLADLSSLWLSVELHEDQIARIQAGAPADITLPYFPGKRFRGTVRFLEPALSDETRTLAARIEIPNPTGELRKGMFATVVFDPVAVPDAVVVPSQAVIRTGRRNVVVVALGEGTFEPREVVLGQEAGGWAEVLEGVEPGETVVTSAQFLLDSESTLREAIRKVIAGRANAPGSSGRGADRRAPGQEG